MWPHTPTYGGPRDWKSTTGIAPIICAMAMQAERLAIRCNQPGKGQRDKGGLMMRNGALARVAVTCAALMVWRLVAAATPEPAASGEALQEVTVIAQKQSEN